MLAAVAPAAYAQRNFALVPTAQARRVHFADLSLLKDDTASIRTLQRRYIQDEVLPRGSSEALLRR